MSDRRNNFRPGNLVALLKRERDAINQRAEKRLVLALVLFIIGVEVVSAQEHRIQEEMLGGLQTLIVHPVNNQEKHPLVVLNHGTPPSRDDLRKMTPWSMLRPAMEFIKQGWKVAIPMRRGYGKSLGEYNESYGHCSNADFLGASHKAANDIRTAISHLRKFYSVDDSRIVLVGQSAGSMASFAAAARPLDGLVGVINFSGGRGGRPNIGEACNVLRLVQTMAVLGKTSKHPSLWLYSENDRFFNAKATATQMHRAYVSSGGKAELIMFPPLGSDGHNLLYRHIDEWVKPVQNFLAQVRR